MSYIENSLVTDEKIIYISRPHRIIFTTSILTLLLSLIIAGFGHQIPNFNMTLYGSWSVADIMGLIIALFSFIMILKCYVNYQFTEYAITSFRISVKTGWLHRNALEIYLKRIEAIHINQSIPGRIFNYGSILIIGMGGTRDSFFFIPDPEKMKNLIINEIKKNRETPNND